MFFYGKNCGRLLACGKIWQILDLDLRWHPILGVVIIISSYRSAEIHHGHDDDHNDEHDEHGDDDDEHDDDGDHDLRWQLRECSRAWDTS